MRLIIHNLGNFLSHRDVKVREYLFSNHNNFRFMITYAGKLEMKSNSFFYLYFMCQDLVQSALLESNTGRDDRILYNRLVSMDV